MQLGEPIRIRPKASVYPHGGPITVTLDADAYYAVAPQVLPHVRDDIEERIEKRVSAACGGVKLAVQDEIDDRFCGETGTNFP